ncbi:MAG TPA: hypothetical protein VEW46_14305 [Pyrinomonadaceae bacterium]|nr:hypothetical protein [Pyrinomonadaceae bacterium]
MERNLKEVFREAAQLPERDRATLAGLLIETLDLASEPEWKQPGLKRSRDA